MGVGAMAGGSVCLCVCMRGGGVCIGTIGQDTEIAIL